MEVSTSLDVPILLIMFNRPAQALQVFNRIREAKPKVLYLTVDGPRSDRPTEEQLVLQCRAIKNYVDWPCIVHTLFRETNLGCKKAVSSAINWFFEQVEYGIILEDDCLPDTSFFSFCQELLLKYRMDERVMHIGGANLLPYRQWSQHSYIFTKVCHIWGWATWRRAWQYYDVEMATFPTDVEAGFIEQQVDDAASAKYWKSVFSEAYNNQVDTWDYQWVYAIWKQNRLCILPEHNLITNIGFDASATHTTLDSPFANMPTQAMTSIKHPDSVDEQTAATAWLFAQLYRLPSRMTVFKNNIKRRLWLLKTLYA